MERLEIHVLAERSKPANRQPRMLIDLERFPAGYHGSILTSDPQKARTWKDRSGPWRYLERRPKLKKELQPLRLQ